MPPAPVADPFNSTTGAPEYPDWVVASIVTGSVTAGSAFARLMVKGALPLI